MRYPSIEKLVACEVVGNKTNRFKNPTRTSSHQLQAQVLIDQIIAQIITNLKKNRSSKQCRIIHSMVRSFYYQYYILVFLLLLAASSFLYLANYSSRQSTSYHHYFTMIMHNKIIIMLLHSTAINTSYYNTETIITINSEYQFFSNNSKVIQLLIGIVILLVSDIKMK